MKIKKILLYALLVLPTLTLQSCLKDDDDAFSETATERIDHYLSDAQKTLLSSENGWALDYYPGYSQQYGGFTYAVKFGEEKATIGSASLESDSATITTLYQFKKDAGAVLSFDSYNDFMHFFATPSSSLYEAYEGDFEFVIDSIAPDLVKVHGKRNHNVLYFRKLNKPMEQYLADARALAGSFTMKYAVGYVNNQVVRVTFGNGNNFANFVQNNSSVSASFTFTDEGIRFYEPVNIAGKSITSMKFDAANNQLVADDDASIVFGALSFNFTDEGGTSTSTVKGVQSVSVSDNAASWLHATQSGDQLSVTADANTTGHVRRGSISVTMTDGSVENIDITQADLKDVLGRYTLKYTEANTTSSGTTTSERTATATIDMGADGKPRIGFRIRLLANDSYTTTVYMPAEWDSKTGSLVIKSGAYLGNFRNAYYMYPIFTDETGSNFTNFDEGVAAQFVFDYSEETGTATAEMYGTYGSIDRLNGFWIGAYDAKEFTNYDHYQGALAKIYKPVLTKQ